MSKQICPKCGKQYSERPALSRADNKTDICSKCGTKEAVDAMSEYMLFKHATNKLNGK